MPLDVNQLKDALKQVFQNGQAATSSDEVAEALAQEIHNYISQATVNGVVVNVVNASNVPIGTGTQTTPVSLS